MITLRPGMAMPGHSGDIVVRSFPATVVVRSRNGFYSIRTMPPGYQCEEDKRDDATKSSGR